MEPHCLQWLLQPRTRPSFISCQMLPSLGMDFDWNGSSMVVVEELEAIGAALRVRITRDRILPMFFASGTLKLLLELELLSLSMIWIWKSPRAASMTLYRSINFASYIKSVRILTNLNTFLIFFRFTQGLMTSPPCCLNFVTSQSVPSCLQRMETKCL